MASFINLSKGVSDRVNPKYYEKKSRNKITVRKLIKTLTQAYQISGDISGVIGKNRNRRHRDLVESKCDQEKLRSDWYNVGQDINKAMKEYDLSHNIREEESLNGREKKELSAFQKRT